jgi:chaperonin GroEL
MMHNLAGVSPTRKAKDLPAPRTPAVTLQPRTYRQLLRGTDLIVDAIRPTLGPRPRLVVLQRTRRTDVPEFLDDGALIARRIIEIVPRGADVGAMLVRHALWKMRQEAGDGAATMGVMYQAILREGIRYVTQFECSPMRLRAALERGARTVAEALRRQASPMAGRRAIIDIAEGMCQGDRPMAELLGEVFDIVGPDGLIVVEGWEKMGLEREYIEGTYWKLSGWLSRLFVTDRERRSASFDDAALLISDAKIVAPGQLIPVLERCVAGDVKRLVIIAAELSDAAIGLLVNNRRAEAFDVMAVRTPKVAEMDRVAAIEDIAILTGGQPYYAAAYPSFDGFRIDHLGWARRAWAMESLFGVYGGKGDPRRIRKRISDIRGMLRAVEDDHARNELQARLGRMHGGTVIVRVGAIHETEREARKAIAERAVTSIRNALLGGVVPGSGAALVQAQLALAEIRAETDDEAIALKILARALEEPARTIARNAGYAPDVIVEKLKAAPPGFGFDARTGQIVDLRPAGILDSVTVLQKALDIAISGAAMALTTDVIVHHSRPVESVEP